MEFKAGDRVHVTRLDSENVNFYGTINSTGANLWMLINCTDYRYENRQIYTSDSPHFGPDNDYYTLAIDEEYTEEPVIQHVLGDIEVKDIVAIVADKYHKGSVAHNVASALEYQMRAPEKNGLEDIKKARKCLDFAIENWGRVDGTK